MIMKRTELSLNMPRRQSVTVRSLSREALGMELITRIRLLPGKQSRMKIIRPTP